jgi:formylglycine-generating enzyme required for sulfatase activity
MQSMSKRAGTIRGAGWGEAARRVAGAATDDFAELIKLAGLDPRKHLRFADWSDLSLERCDLRGFDFTGARLNGCKFDHARIDGARFDQAEIAHTNLQTARDWNAHVKNWRRAPTLIPDDHLPVGAVFQDAPFGPEMVVVPAGKFMMGSPVKEPERFPDEGPQHEVTFARPFAVGRHAVTRGQFAAFVKATKHKMDDRWRNPGFRQDDSHPVVGVNWDGAKAYVSWLAEVTGRPYRLLTEAEWEYVARAGTATPFWWGSSITPAQANYDGNHVYEGGGSKGEYRKGTVPVGSFDPNPWGLYNVHGNVWEWCEDTWHDNYKGAPSDGSAWVPKRAPRGRSNQPSSRVVRGGSWSDFPWDLRSAVRDWVTIENRYILLGFRLARTLTP